MVKSSEAERKERMDTSSLMEQILSSDNLNRAYLQVVRNKGAEGVDGMKYTELKEHLEKNGDIIKVCRLFGKIFEMYGFNTFYL